MEEVPNSDPPELPPSDEPYVEMCKRTGQIAVKADGSTIIGPSAALIKAMQRNPIDPWA